MWHDAQVLMIVAQVKGANVVPIDQELPALKFVETSYQAGYAGFARAGMPHNGYGLARRDF